MWKQNHQLVKKKKLKKNCQTKLGGGGGDDDPKTERNKKEETRRPLWYRDGEAAERAVGDGRKAGREKSHPRLPPSTGTAHCPAPREAGPLDLHITFPECSVASQRECDGEICCRTLRPFFVIVTFVALAASET